MSILSSNISSFPSFITGILIHSIISVFSTASPPSPRPSFSSSVSGPGRSSAELSVQPFREGSWGLWFLGSMSSLGILSQNPPSEDTWLTCAQSHWWKSRWFPLEKWSELRRTQRWRSLRWPGRRPRLGPKNHERRWGRVLDGTTPHSPSGQGYNF